MQYSSILPPKLYRTLKLVKQASGSLKKFDIRNNRLRTFSGIIAANKRYGYSTDEYFLFHYDSLSDEQRMSFIGDAERQRIAETLNDRKGLDLLSDKWTTYKEFKKFFQREACLLMGAKVLIIRCLPICYQGLEN